MQLNPACEENPYLYLINDHFGDYIVTVPTPKKNDNQASNSLTYHWFLKICLPQYLITDTETENHNTELPNCCILFSIRHPPGYSKSVCSDELVELRNRKP